VLLVGRDLKVRYRGSALGMAWTLAGPLLQMAVLTLVFSAIVRLELAAYPLYALSGLLPWSLLAAGTLAASHALLANGGLIRKVKVPQAVFPLAVVGGKAVDLALGLVPLALLAALSGRPPGLAWLALPGAVAVAAAFAAGLALLAASLTVFLRDLRHLLEVGFQAWFYLTPVAWHPDLARELPGPARALLAANPAAPVVGLFQEVVWAGRLPAAGTVALASAWALAALALGAWTFRRLEPEHIHWL
jgi:ABC-type polysaccharide/polyol phosphate export permease